MGDVSCTRKQVTEFVIRAGRYEFKGPVADRLGFRPREAPLHGDRAGNPVTHYEALADNWLTGRFDEHWFPRIGHGYIALECREGLLPAAPPGPSWSKRGDRGDGYGGC